MEKLLVKLKLLFFHLTTERKIREMYSRMCELDYDSFEQFPFFRILAGGSTVEIECGAEHFVINEAINQGDSDVVVRKEVIPRDPNWKLLYLSGAVLVESGWLRVLKRVDKYLIDMGVYVARSKEHDEGFNV